MSGLVLLVEMLDKLQEEVCRTAGPTLAASLEPLDHQRTLASLNLFYMYYFGKCWSELTDLVPLPYSLGRSTCHSDRFHDISVTIPGFDKDIYVNNFFCCTARLWNSLPTKCFSLTYDINSFALTYDLRLKDKFYFWVHSKQCFIFTFNLFPLFLVTTCFVVALQGDSYAKRPRRFFKWIWDFLKEDIFFPSVFTQKFYIKLFFQM